MTLPPASRGDRTVAAVLVAGAALFVGFAVLRLATGAGGAVILPLVLLAADGVIATALVTGWYPIRPVAQGLSAFGMLVHTLVALRTGAIWTRGCSVVLVVAHGWALVALFVRTAREDIDAEDAENDDAENDAAAHDDAENDAAAHDGDEHVDRDGAHDQSYPQYRLVEVPVADLVGPPEHEPHHEPDRGIDDDLAVHQEEPSR